MNASRPEELPAPTADISGASPNAGFLAPMLTLLAILAGVIVTYWPALSAGALYMDDKFYLGPVTQHPSWTSLKAVFGEVWAPSMVNGYYQPLSLLSFMLDFLSPAAATGLAPFHRTTLLLHMANVVLVAILLYALFGKWWTACLLAGLYGVHPLNADAVLWIAERKTVLSTFFALTSLLCYLGYARSAGAEGYRDWRRYSVALFLYVCAVLSKPTALPLVALFVVLDYWPLGRLNRRAWIEKIPFLLVCLLSAVVTVISQARSGDVGQTQFIKLSYLPWLFGYSIGFYLLKLACPAGLVSDYPFPQPLGLSNPEVLGCTIIAIGAIAGIVLSARRTRAWIVGALFFGIALSPTLGIIRFTSSVATNRAMYLPMVGLLIPLCWQLNRWLERAARRSTTVVGAVAVGVGLLAVGSARVTRAYEAHWTDSITLLRYYISQKPDEWKFHTRLGNEWITRKDYPAAIAEFKKAAQLHPNWGENHLNLGRALLTVGENAEAKDAFTAALRQTPNDWRAHMLMGLTLERQQDLDGALEAYGKAAQLAPKAPQPHFNRAKIFMAQGKMDESAAEYRETLRLDPRATEAQRALNAIESRQR